MRKLANHKSLNKKIIISCSYSNSIINLRGKLIEELSKKYHVSIISPQINNNQIRETLEKWGVSIYEITLHPNKISFLSDLKYIFQIRNILSKVQPDIFFAYTIKPILYGNIVSWICGIRKIANLFTGMGYMFLEKRHKTFIDKLFRVILKVSLKINRSTLIFFQNRDDYQELTNLKILNKRSNVLIVNGSGVDLEKFSYNKPDISKVSFLMIAKLVNSKGVREFYESAKIIKNRYPDVTFKLLGEYDGHGTDCISKTLYNDIISNRVIEYLGWLDDVRSVIIDSSVVVLPSYREGVPRSLLEGMAIGRPLITSDAIGCRETIESIPGKINGFMVNQQDINSLTNRMEFFIIHPEKIIEFGLNGREFAVRKFDVNEINNYIMKALRLNS